MAKSAVLITHRWIKWTGWIICGPLIWNKVKLKPPMWSQRWSTLKCKGMTYIDCLHKHFSWAACQCIQTKHQPCSVTCIKCLWKSDASLSANANSNSIHFFIFHSIEERCILSVLSTSCKCSWLLLGSRVFHSGGWFITAVVWLHRHISVSQLPAFKKENSIVPRISSYRDLIVFRLLLSYI